MRTSATIILLSTLSTICLADTIHVPGDQPTIQEGIDAAVNGDTVLVADGTYKKSQNRNIDLKGKNITVKSENGPENCIVDCEKQHRAFLIHSGETRDTVLDGFTIVNGKVGNGIGTQGQGIYIEKSSPIIKNCVVTKCGHYYQGGPYWGPDGGGIFVKGGSPLIRNCLIEKNDAEFGGGIYCHGASPEIERCNIMDNSGLAYINNGMGQPFYEGAGGGLYFSSCTVLVSDCIIKGNLSNANYGGGGAYISGGTGVIKNCTFVDNNCYDEPYQIGEVIDCGGSSFQILNSIIYFNLASETIDGDPHVSFCDVEGGFPGQTNFNSDPLFMNYTENNLKLRPGSPCIDTGDPDFVALGYPEDIDGASRILDGNMDHEAIVDVGAYEYSNIRTSLQGDFTPGSTVQIRIRGKVGLDYIIFGGFFKTEAPPWIKPYGFLLVQLHGGLPPIVPPGKIPDDVYLLIPSNAPVGAWIYLLPTCMDPASMAGNFGAYLKLTVKL